MKKKKKKDLHCNNNLYNAAKILLWKNWFVSTPLKYFEISVDHNNQDQVKTKRNPTV